MTSSPKKWITIYCGSSSGTNNQYTKQAKELGVNLAKNQFGLMYGGASIGVMGAVADGFLSENAPVIGVIPTVLMKREVAHFHLTELIEVQTMHERKAIMMEKADVFVALPGGFGTLEELFEVATWLQLGIHNKPIYVFNQDGFYDELIKLIESMILKGFVRESNRSLIRFCSTLEELISELVAVQPLPHNTNPFKII